MRLTNALDWTGLMMKAIFDAVLVHMMNVVSPGTWHGLKLDLCNALVKNKDTITLQILANSYAKTDMVFLQVPRAFPPSCGPHPTPLRPVGS